MPNYVQAEFRHECSLVLPAEACATVGAVVAIIRCKAGGKTCFSLDAPVVCDPPRMAEKETAAPERTLEAEITDLGIHTEREAYGSDIVMCVDEICADEPAVPHVFRPPSGLGDDGEIAPVAVPAGIIPIPEAPARPRLQSCRKAESDVVAHTDIERKVRFGRSIPQQIGPQCKCGISLGTRFLRRCSYAQAQRKERIDCKY